MNLRDRLSGGWQALLGAFTPADFVIRHRPGRPVAVSGRLPRGKVAAIASFFARDLNPARPVTIRGVWGSSRGVQGTLRLRFGGGLGPADRQRVRNFLVEHLR